MDTGYFVGYAPHWITLDKLYLVVAQPNALIGLRVGGQLVPMNQWQPSDPRAYFKAKLAARYEGRNLQDPTLVHLDDQNFLLRSAEVASVVIKRRRSLWTGQVPNSGSIVVRLRRGRTRRFILIGHQDHHHVALVLSDASMPLFGEAERSG